MNVLVVDDQYDVVQGVLTGVDWKSLHIANVYHAYSADEARTQLREKGIHIILCDIEMPVENGLELFKWARKENPALQCIFLSAHSEFEYAKEAIQLGSFDYIVQPASYEDIQASIERAIQTIRANTEMRQLYEFGAYWRKNEDLLLENYIRTIAPSMSTIAPETNDRDRDRNRNNFTLLLHSLYYSCSLCRYSKGAKPWHFLNTCEKYEKLE